MKENTPIENKNLPDIKEAPQGIAKTEQEAWQNILGTRVEVKPLPDSVAPEVKGNLERMGFGLLRYVPALDLGSISTLREKGVEEYLAELQEKYPKWKHLESLSRKERRDHTVPRNLGKTYWEWVENGNIKFPVLPGQWMAVETVDKPSYGKKYASTPFAERLGHPLEVKGDKFWSWDITHGVIEREKGKILSDIGLLGQSVDLRFLEATEWNLLANREGWGKTNTSEWINTELRVPGYLYRLVVGDSDGGGAGYVRRAHPYFSHIGLGFRAAVVLDS